MRRALAVFACTAVCSSPLIAQERWQFVAADEADFIVYATGPDQFEDSGEVFFSDPVGIVSFGEDYSALGVPEAPNSDPGDAATTGLVMGVNLGGFAQRSDAAGVWTDAIYSGNYRVEVDVYYFWNGGGGSTENPIIGVNHMQTEKPLNFSQNNAQYSNPSLNLQAPNLAAQSGLDGYFLNIFGDIDLIREDIVFFYGLPNEDDGEGGIIPGVSPINRPTGVSVGGNRGEFGTGLTWGDGLRENFNFRDAEEQIPVGDPENPDEENPLPVDFFFNLFPYGTPVGSVTNVWTTFRFDYVDGVLDIYVRQWPNDPEDGEPTEFEHFISYDDPERRWTSGRVYLGHEDVFSGINEFNRMVYDNLVITELGDTGPIVDGVFTKVGEIDVSSLESTPTDIVVMDDDTILVGGFAQRRVLRIDDATTAAGTPSIYLSTVAGDGTPIISQGWGTGAGISSLDISPDGRFLLVTGRATNNPGNNDFEGVAFIVDLIDDSLVHNLTPGLIDDGALKMNAGVFYGEEFEGGFLGEIVTTFQGGTHLAVLPFELDSWAFVGDTGTGTFGRQATDAVTVQSEDGMIVFITGNTRYFAPGDLGESEDVIVIRRFDPDDNPFAFSNANPVPGMGGAPAGWFEIKGENIAVNEYQGIGVFKDTANDKTYVGVANPTQNRLNFVNIDDRTDTFTLSAGLDSPANFVHKIRSDGAEFLYVSQGNGTVAVFAIGETDPGIDPVLGDINGDGVVNVADVTELANRLAANDAPPANVGDINNDGLVNEADIQALADLIVND